MEKWKNGYRLYLKNLVYNEIGLEVVGNVDCWFGGGSWICRSNLDLGLRFGLGLDSEVMKRVRTIIRRGCRFDVRSCAGVCRTCALCPPPPWVLGIHTHRCSGMLSPTTRRGSPRGFHA